MRGTIAAAGPSAPPCQLVGALPASECTSGIVEVIHCLPISLSSPSSSSSSSSSVVFFVVVVVIGGGVCGGGGVSGGRQVARLGLRLVFLQFRALTMQRASACTLVACRNGPSQSARPANAPNQPRASKWPRSSPTTTITTQHTYLWVRNQYHEATIERLALQQALLGVKRLVIPRHMVLVLLLDARSRTWVFLAFVRKNLSCVMRSRVRPPGFATKSRSTTCNPIPT